MKIQSVAVIGAGTMGRGIAQWFAQQELAVKMVEPHPKVLQEALAAVHSSWERLTQKGKFSAAKIQRFKDLLTVGPLEELTGVDLVVEAIIEDLPAKKELFQRLHQSLPSHTLMASNTSSFPIALLTADLPRERQERFLGLHFFNPAPVMKLVEIIQGPHTPRPLCQELKGWFEARGKKPALCQDAPGFIVNRVARNFYGEALRVAARDDEERFARVDEVLREVGGFKMGPFELMDLIGVDINYAVTESLWRAEFFEPRFAPHPLQRKLVQGGRLGRKSQQGFYDYGTSHGS